MTSDNARQRTTKKCYDNEVRRRKIDAQRYAWRRRMTTRYSVVTWRRTTTDDYNNNC